MQQSPFSIRGVIEGFYGTFYTWPERNDLVRRAGTHGFNLCVYASKNDRQHRSRWWEPYAPTTNGRKARPCWHSQSKPCAPPPATS